jgi:hypothetical protein
LTITKSPTVSAPDWTPRAAIAITATRPAVMITVWPTLSQASEVAVCTAARS